MKFEIFEDNQAFSHTYRWRLLADDGRILARSEKYKSFKACQSDIHYVALSAVSISLDHLLSPENFSLADLISSADASLDDVSPDDASASGLDFFSLATPTSLPEGIFE